MLDFESYYYIDTNLTNKYVYMFSFVRMMNTPIIMRFLKWRMYENIQEICVYLRNIFEQNSVFQQFNNIWLW
jgi:hypothetical protein